MPKLIGIDYGTKRVGVAVSDTESKIAFPKATYPNDRTLIPSLVDLIRKENATEVIVGESHKDDGAENSVMKNIRTFVQELQREVAVSIQYEPEFYTSVEARRLLAEAESNKKFVDAEAAALILNSYMVRTGKS